MFSTQGRLLSLLVFIPINVFGQHSITEHKDPISVYAFVSSLSFGAAWIQGHKTETLYLQPDVAKTYTASSDNPSTAVGALFFGMQRILNAQLQGQLGLELVTTGNSHLSGDIWDDANPEFNNYTYRYTINHSHVALKAKLLFDKGMIVTPYVSGSLGIGTNKAFDYSSTPRDSADVPPPAFLSNTKTQGVYTLGIGLQKNLTHQYHLGLGYEFAYWGRSNLAAAPGQTSTQGINTNALNAQQVLFSLSYTA